MSFVASTTLMSSKSSSVPTPLPFFVFYSSTATVSVQAFYIFISLNGRTTCLHFYHLPLKFYLRGQMKYVTPLFKI